MGALSRSYTALSGSFTDTLRNAISVKGSLTRLGLQAERQLGHRWLLRAGPVVNLLRTTYYHKDNTTSNNKLWVGLQLTLLYRIPSFKAD